MRFYLFFLIILAGFLAVSAAPSEIQRLNYQNFDFDLLPEDPEVNIESSTQSITLAILPETVRGVNLDNGNEVELHKARLITPWGTSSISKPAKISGEIPESFQITISREGVTKQVKLPPWLSERLKEYLLFGAPSKPFDCSSFVHYMLGVQHDFAAFDRSEWLVRGISQEPTSPGAVVAIGLSSSFSRKKITHFGIHLGDGLYISKFGVLGSLVITTLDEMKRAFGGSHVFLLKPRDQSKLNVAASPRTTRYS